MVFWTFLGTTSQKDEIPLLKTNCQNSVRNVKGKRLSKTLILALSQNQPPHDYLRKCLRKLPALGQPRHCFKHCKCRHSEPLAHSCNHEKGSFLQSEMPNIWPIHGAIVKVMCITSKHSRGINFVILAFRMVCNLPENYFILYARYFSI